MIEFSFFFQDWLQKNVEGNRRKRREGSEEEAACARVISN